MGSKIVLTVVCMLVLNTNIHTTQLSDFLYINYVKKKELKKKKK